MASTSALLSAKFQGLEGKKTTKTYQSEPGISLLPISRVHRIIRADKDIKLCSKEAIFLISKATEFFLGKVTNLAYQTARLQKRSKTIKYGDLSSITTRPEWFYLAEIIPSTIPLHKALALRVTPAEGSTSLIEPSDPNHPSHPSSTSNGPHQLAINLIKKARKKSIGGEKKTTPTKKAKKVQGSAGKAITKKKKLSKKQAEEEEDEEEDEDDEDDDEEEQEEEEEEGMDIDV